MIKKSILNFAFFLILNLHGQSSKQKIENINFPIEKIQIHNSNNFLITGETLYYSINCLNNLNLPSPYSTIAYVEIIDKNNTSILKQKVSLNEGHGYGDIFINSKIKSGTYKIVGYTQLMKNHKAFYEQELYVINPFTSKIKVKNTSTYLPDYKSTNKKAFSNLKSDYKRREKVKINLENTVIDNIEKLSVSIRKTNDFNLPNRKGEFKSNGKNQTFYLPELRGSLIHGKLTSTTNKNLANINLSIATQHNDRLPINVTTNIKGEFFFNLTNITDDKVYIQIVNQPKNEYQISIIPHKGIEKKFNDFTTITIDDKIATAIQKRNIYAQIENSYADVKKDTIINIKSKSNLFSKIKETYNLDDYKRFKTTKETFIEIIPLAGFNSKNNNYQFYVIPDNASKIFRHLNALVIVDGRILQNHNDLINYDARKIKSIAIVRSEYYYGNSRYKGVILVDTFKNDFFNNSIGASDSYTIMPTEPYKKYFFQSEKNRMDTRIPDYRTQLYWNPNLDITSKAIVFFTSDVTGKFEIEIEGFTKKGVPIYIKDYFTVNE
ncbi:hypothetical protein [Tenacibaculum jejuense]|uniref:Uncharacterized protein n=1 Tax=Tenacibaculum jejuense TaxID=584609 RepID=A0A238U8A0_9FLAO|nr:hypothetical protein [Tenacibaculum jejuense]SNR15387.1 conserved protein of unknown function [Tenacibaculum jejuense]